MNRRMKRIVVALIITGVLAILVGPARVGSAQQGSASAPPTYDYDDMVPGVQGPTSPTVAGATNRQLRAFTVTVPLSVPLAELQGVLPPGFNAVATPAGSNTGQLTLTFALQQRDTQIADGRTVVGSLLSFQTNVLNTNVVPNRQEVGFLGQEISSQELVDYYLAVFGPGSARLANVNMQITEGGGTFTFKATVTDPGFGLYITVQTTAPGPIVNRIKNDPSGNINRYLISQRAFRTASQSDTLVVPQAMANLQLDTPYGELWVPVAGGGFSWLTILGIGGNITFRQNQELFRKFE